MRPGLFSHLLSIELSETKIPSHKYDVVVQKLLNTLQLPYITFLLYLCFSPGDFTCLSELYSC